MILNDTLRETIKNYLEFNNESLVIDNHTLLCDGDMEIIGSKIRKYIEIFGFNFIDVFNIDYIASNDATISFKTPSKIAKIEYRHSHRLFRRLDYYTKTKKPVKREDILNYQSSMIAGFSHFTYDKKDRLISVHDTKNYSVYFEYLKDYNVSITFHDRRNFRIKRHLLPKVIDLLTFKTIAELSGVIDGLFK